MSTIVLDDTDHFDDSEDSSEQPEVPDREGN